MSRWKHHTHEFRLEIADQYLKACGSRPKLTLAEFRRERRLVVSISTLWRWVETVQRDRADGVTMTAATPGSDLSQTERGTLVGLADLHLPSSRKRRGAKPPSAVINQFRDICRDKGMILKLPTCRLQQIIRERELVKMTLDEEGLAAYDEATGSLLPAAHRRLERIQIDSFRIEGPFLTADGQFPEVHILAAICLATNLIVNTTYHFHPPHGSDAVKLVHGIMSGSGGGVNSPPGPIGAIQVDNGIFRSEVLRGFVERTGAKVIRNRPGRPQQNGSIEKAQGDIKHGMTMKLQRQVGEGLEETNEGGQCCYTEPNMAVTLRRVVSDLNEGHRRAESPRARWEKTAPIQDGPRDFLGKLTVNSYMIHHRIEFDRRRVIFDRTRIACARFEITAPAEKCFVRETLGADPKFELWIQTLPQGRRRLCTLTEVGERMECVMPEVIPTSCVVQTELSFT